MIYLDSSALVKLALTEPESAALAHWLAERADQPLVSSALHRAEVPRAVWRAEPGALPRSYRVMKRIARVDADRRRAGDSATLPPQHLSPAQAIHLASALALAGYITAFVATTTPARRGKGHRAPRRQPGLTGPAGRLDRLRGQKERRSV